MTFVGQAVGLGTLAVAVGEEADTVEEVYEPFLLKQGLLLRTPRGRVATPAAYAHLDVAPPPGVATLFECTLSPSPRRSLDPRSDRVGASHGICDPRGSVSANLPDPACLSSSSTSRCSQSRSSS